MLNNNVHPDKETFLDDVITGLSHVPKFLACKYLYDSYGSKLFNKICLLDEYYLTRTETTILIKNRKKISSHIGENAALIEYGSGSLDKTKILLSSLESPRTLIAIDISQSELKDSIDKITSIYPKLSVIPILGDFTQRIDLSNIIPKTIKRVVFFPGSTIGNFSHVDATSFLKEVSLTIGKGGLLLIGVDLKKDPKRLIDAYDDNEGVTAEFNKNIITRINNELSANFLLNNFKHKAIYNEKLGRIEMHLQSLCDQSVTISRTRFHFKLGETIHTESAHKYTITEFHKIADTSGFKTLETWCDDENLFSVHLLSAKG